jgi:hypothetical protein
MQLPRRKVSKTDIEEPNWSMDTTDKALPTRRKFRRLNVVPRLARSNAERLEPSLVAFHTLMQDPTRQ